MKSLKPRVVALFTGGMLIASILPALAQPDSKPHAQLAAAPAAEPGTARGVVKSVTDTRLVLDGKQSGSAGETLLVLDDRTVFQRLGKTLTVKDLKAGDPVTVTYTMKDGKAVATRVWVRFAPAGAGRSNGGKAR